MTRVRLSVDQFTIPVFFTQPHAAHTMQNCRKFGFLRIRGFGDNLTARKYCNEV